MVLLVGWYRRFPLHFHFRVFSLRLLGGCLCWIIFYSAVWICAVMVNDFILLLYPFGINVFCIKEKLKKVIKENFEAGSYITFTLILKPSLLVPSCCGNTKNHYNLVLVQQQLCWLCEYFSCTSKTLWTFLKD